MVPHAPLYQLSSESEVSFVSYVQPATQYSTSQEMFKKYVVIKVANHYEKYGIFPLQKGSHHEPPQNQCQQSTL